MKKVAAGLSAVCLSALLAVPAFAETGSGTTARRSLTDSGVTSGTTSTPDTAGGRSDNTATGHSVIVGSPVPGTRSTSYGPGTVGISGYGGRGTSTIGTSDFTTGATGATDSPTRSDADRARGGRADAADANAGRDRAAGADRNSRPGALTSTGVTSPAGRDADGTANNRSDAYPYRPFNYNPDRGDRTTRTDGNYSTTSYTADAATDNRTNGGWLGLLGLVGLAGLFGRNRNRSDIR